MSQLEKSQSRRFLEEEVDALQQQVWQPAGSPTGPMSGNSSMASHGWPNSSSNRSSNPPGNNSLITRPRAGSHLSSGGSPSSAPGKSPQQTSKNRRTASIFETIKNKLSSNTFTSSPTSSRRGPNSQLGSGMHLPSTDDIGSGGNGSKQSFSSQAETTAGSLAGTNIAGFGMRCATAVSSCVQHLVNNLHQYESLCDCVEQQTEYRVVEGLALSDLERTDRENLMQQLEGVLKSIETAHQALEALRLATTGEILNHRQVLEGEADGSSPLKWGTAKAHRHMHSDPTASMNASLDVLAYLPSYYNWSGKGGVRASTPVVEPSPNVVVGKTSPVPLSELRGEEKQKAEERLRAFYKQHSPEKVDNAAKLMHFHMSEDAMMQDLRNKYKAVHPSPPVESEPAGGVEKTEEQQQEGAGTKDQDAASSPDLPPQRTVHPLQLSEIGLVGTIFEELQALEVAESSPLKKMPKRSSSTLTANSSSGTPHQITATEGLHVVRLRSEQMTLKMRHHLMMCLRLTPSTILTGLDGARGVASLSPAPLFTDGEDGAKQSVLEPTKCKMAWPQSLKKPLIPFDHHPMQRSLSRFLERHRTTLETDWATLASVASWQYKSFKQELRGPVFQFNEERKVVVMELANLWLRRALQEKGVPYTTESWDQVDIQRVARDILDGRGGGAGSPTGSFTAHSDPNTILAASPRRFGETVEVAAVLDLHEVVSELLPCLVEDSLDKQTMALFLYHSPTALEADELFLRSCLAKSSDAKKTIERLLMLPNGEPCPVRTQCYDSAVSMLRADFDREALMVNLCRRPHVRSSVGAQLKRLVVAYRMIESITTYTRPQLEEQDERPWAFGDIAWYADAEGAGGDGSGEAMSNAVGADTTFPLLLSAISDARPRMISSWLMWIRILQRPNKSDSGLAKFSGFVLATSGLEDYVLATVGAVVEAMRASSEH